MRGWCKNVTRRTNIGFVATLTMTNAKTPAIDADALVIGCAQLPDGPQVLVAGMDGLDGEVKERLQSVAKQLSLTGAPDSIYKYPAPRELRAKTLVLTGLGKPEADGSFKPETLRRAAGAALRSLSGAQSAAIALPTPDDAALTAIVEGAYLGNYNFNKYKSKDKDAPVSDIQVVTDLTRSERAKAAFGRAEIVANAVAHARDLVDTPPNILYPESFAEIAKTKANKLVGNKIKVDITNYKQLVAGGYGGLAGVGQGSARKPCLVTLTYAPAGATKHVGLVGKGITFDSGGISIKKPEGMHIMTMDMAGAAVVLQVVIAAAQLELPIAVTGYLCLAENLPGGDAQRPGDIVTMRDGTTVEIINTDAEGRLVMADGIADAVSAGCSPIVDIATLTGAQVAALGSRTAGVMGSDEVRDQLVKAANESGEQAWPMPLPQELSPSQNSQLADLVNSAGNRDGGMLWASQFLKHFYKETPWGHIDCAGPSWNKGAGWGYTPTGATGFGVRTLISFLEDLAASGS